MEYLRYAKGNWNLSLEIGDENEFRQRRHAIAAIGAALIAVAEELHEMNEARERNEEMEAKLDDIRFTRKAREQF